MVVERLVAAAPGPGGAGCRSRAPPRAPLTLPITRATARSLAAAAARHRALVAPAGSSTRQDSVSRLYAMRAGKVASREARIALARVTSNTHRHPAIVHGQ